MTLPFTEFELASLSIKAIHPMLVHFPIVLIYLIPLTHGLYFWRQKAALIETSRWVMLLAWFASLSAVIAGHITAHLKSLHFQDPAWIESAPDLALGIQIHRTLGFVCLAFVTVLVAMEFFIPGSKSRPRSVKTVVVWTMAILTCAMVTLTAHIGAYLEI